MAKYDHKEFEKDIPKKERDKLLPCVFFSNKGKGVYMPIVVDVYNPFPLEVAELLNFSWKLWCKQQDRIEKLKDEQT